tara:strand:- start:370 stop:504 length:135 start_codon:yes stop_codon:yes gene_type:complete
MPLGAAASEASVAQADCTVACGKIVERLGETALDEPIRVGNDGL